MQSDYEGRQTALYELRGLNSDTLANYMITTMKKGKVTINGHTFSAKEINNAIATGINAETTREAVNTKLAQGNSGLTNETTQKYGYIVPTDPDNPEKRSGDGGGSTPQLTDEEKK
jgi:hypothetical protein